MSIRVALSHVTRYEYDRHIALSPQVVRLRPAPHNRTPIHAYSLRIEPKQHFLNWQQDPYGNFLARIVVPEKTNRFVVQVDLVADLEAFNPFDFFVDPSAEEAPFEYDERHDAELAPYLERVPLTSRFEELLKSIDTKPKRTVDFLVEINQRVSKLVDYVIRMEPGVQTPEETLDRGRGSCRDSGWLLVQLFRHLGVAARFVSGYLVQLKPDQPPIRGPRGPVEDFTDLHAWCECFVPGAGWIGLDPTSGLLAAEGHIPLACTANPGSAAPIEGAVEKAETQFGFEMRVDRIIDVPRVTKPYSDDQWRAVLDLGRDVDARMRRGDVRLTMGGEPTFISTREPDAPEWNTAALGGQKESMGDALLRRLHDLWKPGGLIHHGQGKWYPGEQLPRWALSCFYRVDGEPLWTNPSLIAASGKNLGHDETDAFSFAKQLVANLGLRQSGLMPAHEDAWYYMWRERRLPTNVDPLDSRLDDPTERERLTRVFRQGLGKTVGYVLPLARVVDGWVSGSWFLRDEHCFLLPGDSPMGFRLPLDSQPWVAPSEDDRGTDPDPTVQRPPLPTRFEFPLRPPREESAQVLRQPYRVGRDGEPGRAAAGKGRGDVASRTASHPFSHPLHGESATGITRTAMCIEPREGILRIFLPPVDSGDAFVELVAAVERTASDLQLAVQIEGYPPPTDPRFGVFRITPDPGVIEVNLPYVHGWDELVTQTAQLYDAARHEDLAAEKFELDGLHVGSGGGNHLVLGGETPLDSPFLRRPDLIESLLRFWHNHPALSYLFSGRFIGPTSQAPRVDEARHENVHELELAFEHLPRRGQSAPPWLVDRVLRNLLVDVTGNTHRTEFCIDKLYSPDGVTGRLGLVELRAFEMPPHERMANVQQLLVRALISTFWDRPYSEPLVRWGTALHDRFLLPHFVHQDMRDVVRFLGNRDLPFDPEWFEPHYQFRFPFYGQVTRDGVALEVRGALEPWHVLGEEAGAGGQARYVDSSLERLQVKVKGITSQRYRVCCNGVELPLHPTGTVGEGVCGVRFRAWQPPSCLHPTIGVHHPLHFDVYDSWNEQSIAGCTYHVVHPGGRANEDRPVNAVAAESRRIARFEAAGHTPGSYAARPAQVNRDFPMTLDLRHVS